MNKIVRFYIKDLMTVIKIYQSNEYELFMEHDNGAEAVIETLWQIIEMFNKEPFFIELKVKDCLYTVSRFKFSLWDNDMFKVLATGSNSVNLKKLFSCYLSYRKEDIGDWTDSPDIAPTTTKVIAMTTENFPELNPDVFFDIWVNEVLTNDKGIDFVLEDLNVAEFQLLITDFKK